MPTFGHGGKGGKGPGKGVATRSSIPCHSILKVFLESVIRDATIDIYLLKLQGRTLYGYIACLCRNHVGALLVPRRCCHRRRLLPEACPGISSELFLSRGVGRCRLEASGGACSFGDVQCWYEIRARSSSLYTILQAHASCNWLRRMTNQRSFGLADEELSVLVTTDLTVRYGMGLQVRSSVFFW